MIHRRWLLGAAILAGPLAAIAATPMPAYITAAVADATRPPADSQRDPDRKPAEMLQFAELKPGQAVADINPGGGYFTRLFSTAVGARGHVYAVDMGYTHGNQPPRPNAPPPPPPVSSEPGHANVTVVKADANSLNAPMALDMAWTSENYHDFHIAIGDAGVAAFDKAVFAALKPGGLFLISDHAANAGISDDDIKKLHRIDEERVKREVTAAGFVFDAESDATRNPADPHTANVRDPSIANKTDRFTLRFRKPS